ncbi:MAG: hypothetical protein LBT22_04115 [Peptococcaceae bacterium]|jgi:predicted membrane protein|nr:hypothetical protein [Peptococcaceae bacterium]
MGIFRKNKKEEKSPLQKALDRIKAAYIFAFISAGLTLIITLVAVLGGFTLVNGINIYSLADVVFILILAILLKTIKSRVAAVILFVHFMWNKVLMWVDNPQLAYNFTWFLFAAGFFYGILGTFSYHKLKKQEEAALKMEIETKTETEMGIEAEAESNELS